MDAGVLEDTGRALVARYVAAYNAFDIEGMLAQLSENLRFENHAGGELTAQTDGIEAFRQLAEQSRTLFAEREQRITHLRQEGATLVADVAYRGRLARDIPGGPAAGAVLELSGQSEFSFAGGRISRIVDRS